MKMRLILMATPLLFLAACGDDDPAGAGPGEVGGEASGEVLGGTISDDMIPLDQLTSVSPPADPAAASDAGGSTGSTADADLQPQAENEEGETASAAPPPAAPARATPPPPATAPATPSAPTVAPPLED